MSIVESKRPNFANTIANNRYGKQTTRLARPMVTRWWMSEKIGPIAFRRGEEHIFLGREMTQQRDFSEHIAPIIDAEISNLLKDIEQGITTLLGLHRPQLESLANALLEQETLAADEIQSICG